MGQDYSYSQPSSSSASIDITSLIEAEGQLYADDAESSYNVAEPVQYPPQPESDERIPTICYNVAEPSQYQPQPESDEGIPTICYCGGEPVLATSHNPKSQGRRYFTCPNVDDGDCHIEKWFDVAVMEEVREFHTQVRQLKDQVKETDQKLVVVEKTVCELSKKSSAVKQYVCLFVLGLVLLFLLGLAAKASPASNENVYPL